MAVWTSAGADTQLVSHLCPLTGGNRTAGQIIYRKKWISYRSLSFEMGTGQVLQELKARSRPSDVAISVVFDERRQGQICTPRQQKRYCMTDSDGSQDAVWPNYLRFPASSAVFSLLPCQPLFSQYSMAPQAVSTGNGKRHLARNSVPV